MQGLSSFAKSISNSDSLNGVAAPNGTLICYPLISLKASYSVPSLRPAAGLSASDIAASAVNGLAVICRYAVPINLYSQHPPAFGQSKQIPETS